MPIKYEHRGVYEIPKEETEALISDPAFKKVLIPMRDIMEFVRTYLQSTKKFAPFRDGCQLLYYPPKGLFVFPRSKSKS